MLFAGRVHAADNADMMSYAGTEESRSVASDSSALPCHVAPSVLVSGSHAYMQFGIASAAAGDSTLHLCLV